MCDVLNVSETGYYRFKRNLGRPGKDAVLSAVIQDVLDEHPFNDNYGVDRMQIALMHRGYTVGKRRISRIMKENGWLHERKRRPKGLTRATTEIQEKENLIKQDFTSDQPYQKLLTDISQISCRDGKLYISPIMDCFNGEIISLVMRSNMRKELCIDTFNAAAKRFPLNGAILHSDRGSQYTSEAFREKLSNAGVLQSLSGVNHCFDNARMESFFATLKKELLYRIPTYKMKMDEVKAIIFRYVFVYYNRIRIYTSNPDGLPPAAYRRHLEQPLAEAA
ncbi:MAG: IS3 family transposase [Firmicutes bacterium]|nr:IS3 family transposase [Bacillota bacterium]